MEIEEHGCYELPVDEYTDSLDLGVMLREKGRPFRQDSAIGRAIFEGEPPQRTLQAIHFLSNGIPDRRRVDEARTIP